MQFVLNGRLYDTETATRIGTYTDNALYRDMYYMEDTLYRKDNGEYFILREGGPATYLGYQSGPREWSSGWEVISYKPDEAKEWAAQHLSYEDYSDEFGTVNE